MKPLWTNNPTDVANSLQHASLGCSFSRAVTPGGGQALGAGPRRLPLSRHTAHTVWELLRLVFFLLSFYFNSRTLLHTKWNCRNNCRIQSLADKYYSGSKLGNHRTFFFFSIFFSLIFFWVKFHLCCMVGTLIVFHTVF